MIDTYTSLHVHSEYSSALLGFTDSIIHIKDALNWCYKRGLRGMSLSDHEGCSGFIEMEQAVNEMKLGRPFQHIFANEIYLLSEQENELKNDPNERPHYWHFLLNCLDEEGVHMLYELSSRAWLRSYVYRGLRRRPTFYTDIEEIIGKNQGHIVGSSACFTKGHLVDTLEGFKAIETITSNDFVLSSDGKYHKVISPTSRMYSGNACKLGIEKTFDDILCTEDHKFLILQNNHLVWHKAKDLHKNDICVEPVPTKKYSPYPKKVIETDCYIEELKQKENYVSIGIRANHIKKKIAITPEFMRTMGYWLADGHCRYNILQGNYSVGFTINKKEYDSYKKWLFKGMNSICDFSPYVNFREESNRVDVSYNSRELAYLFKSWFNDTTAYYKHIPAFLKKFSKELNAELLFGYLLGDGYFRYRPKYGGEIVCASISKQLTFDIAQLFLEQGFSASYNINHEKVDKNKVHHCEAYYLTVSCKDLPTKLNKETEISHDVLISLLNQYGFDKRKFIEINNTWYALKKIKSKATVKVSEKVYCLNVSETHNFVCHNVIVHNCLGGYLPHLILGDDTQKAKEFISWGVKTFGEGNFFLECQPCLENNEEQITVNKALWQLHEELNVPIIATTDAHYLEAKDRLIHKAYLASKDGGDTREADSFYMTAHLFSPSELRDTLHVCFNDEQIDVLFQTTNEIADRVQPFSLKKTTQVPALPSLPEFKIAHKYKHYYLKYEFINYFANSNDPYEQYYYYQVEKGLSKHEATHDIDLDKYLSQINTEMEQVKGLGDIFGHQRMCDYFTVVQKVIDLIWSEGDSLVGIGRGSAGCYVTNFLLGITGIDPQREELTEFYPWWRFCSTARSDSIFDIDIDIESFQKEKIIQAIKDYFGERRVCQVVTWGKLSARTAIERACRGMGISMDVAGYLRSLVPVKRGAIYSLNDCLYGNEKKGRSKVPGFANELNKYPGLLDTALAFEGLVISSGVHAGALNVLKSDFTDTGALMVSPNGAIINQYDLHHGEYGGQLKFDLLSIDALCCIRSCLNLLLDNKKIEWRGSLRKTYNYYLRYEALEQDDKKMWDLLPTMVNAFQYDSRAGQDALRKVGAQNLIELTLANGLMRLAVSEGEQPMDKYVRYRKDISEWYKDMTDYGIGIEEQEILKDLLSPYYGLMIAQATMMKVLMDKRICGFTLKQSDRARKAVAKKNAEAMAETEKLLYEKGAACGRSKAFLDYLWNVQIEMSKSYAFDFSHSHEYSTECLQELNLYYKFPKVYWNTAVITTQAQVEDEREGSAVAINYGKIAQSIYKAKNNGIIVKAPSINNSGLAFTPREEDGSILFGLGAISGINNDVAGQILSNRPYPSFTDFYNKNAYKGSLVTKSKFIQLIKAGCFDEFEPDRRIVMRQYFILSTPNVTSLAMNNIVQIKSARVPIPKSIIGPYNFRKYVCSRQFLFGKHPKFKSKTLYWLDDMAQRYFNAHCKNSLTEGADYWFDSDAENWVVVDKSLKKLLAPSIETLKAYINTPEFLDKFNKARAKQAMIESIDGLDVNRWAFSSISFYPDEHELSHIDRERYNISLFNELPEEPKFITKSYGKREWKQFALSQIACTVIDKNDNHHMLTVLDIGNNVIQCKFNAEVYSFYKAQLSETDSSGNKIVMDKPWFRRGQTLILTGVRMGVDDFRVKSYKNSIYNHKVLRVDSIDNETGKVVITSYRYGQNPEE